MTTSIESSKAEVLQLVDEMQKSWNAHDAKAYAGSFAENAEFTNVFGTVNRGRKTIEEGHAFIFARMFKNSRVTIHDTSVRFIKPGVASVHIWWSMTGATQPDGTPWKERKGILTWIVVNQNQRWEIVEALNSETLQPLPGMETVLRSKS